MASTTFRELYDEIDSGQVTSSSIPEGVYDVTVTRAQPLSTSNMVFLTLQVLNGPAAGKETDVSLWFPNENAKRGARIYFHKKFAGFATYPDVKQALSQAAEAATDETAFELIAGSLEGKNVTATVALTSSGQYAGQNELRETKAATAPVSASAQTATASAPVEAQTPEATTVPF